MQYDFLPVISFRRRFRPHLHLQLISPAISEQRSEAQCELYCFNSFNTSALHFVFLI